MRKLFIKFAMAAFVAGIFGTFSVSETNAQGVLNDILKLMQSHKESLQSLRADVSMAKTDSTLGITDTQNGDVFYLPAKGKDAYVRIDWKNPEETLAVANGKYLLYRPKLGQAIVGKVQGNKNTKASGALAFMSMSKQELNDNYEVLYLGKVALGGTDVWHLGLTPKFKQSYKSANLWVDGNGMPVQAKIVEKNNDSTTVRLSNLRKNVKIKGSVFKVDLPKKVKIIEG